MKKIRIFLASSAELDQDKLQVELFVSRKNKDWHSRRIFLELTTWKDFISSITQERTQNEYNRYIRSSDISIFLFHTRLGRYTKEEFDEAHHAFLASGGKVKKPRIFTYFKTDPTESADIAGFRDYIDSLDHFYDTYDSMDELFVKLNRQLDKLENEGLVIKPDRIDLPRILKYTVYYFLLPVLVLSGAWLAFYYFQPTDLTVKITEEEAIPGLPFREGVVALTYGDKTDTMMISSEVIFKQIPSRYKREKANLRFTARGYRPVDTMVAVRDLITLSIRRDNSLGVIFGTVKDGDLMPVEGVTISVKEIRAVTDAMGKFRIEIPLAMQSEEQRLTAIKDGFEPWDFTGIPSETEEWKVVLNKIR
ncbi:MAG TPA: carboxypeptidase-like regulatory domain-containing protein [Bacteroidales bacterium]|nr:carboxypeptidase-like regulatory domain-containing protein [Bacteroidales bacterium]HRZ47793.1 carboxypeptidase-like regulatory domain-containing protein [Bacteroidales bacterium]